MRRKRKRKRERARGRGNEKERGRETEKYRDRKGDREKQRQRERKRERARFICMSFERITRYSFDICIGFSWRPLKTHADHNIWFYQDVRIHAICIKQIEEEKKRGRGREDERKREYMAR